MLNKKILCLVLLFLLGMAHLQAQCLELEQKLNKRNLPEQIAEWNVTLKPVTADELELRVQLTVLKELQLATTYHEFNFSHYGFEVLTRKEQIGRPKNHVKVLSFFGRKLKKGTVIVENIRLRKKKAAAIYLIEGTGYSNVYSNEERTRSCGCNIIYTNPFELLSEDPEPKTIIVDNNEGYIFEEAGCKVSCGGLN